MAIWLCAWLAMSLLFVLAFARVLARPLPSYNPPAMGHSLDSSSSKASVDLPTAHNQAIPLAQPSSL
jgi:hypothetical protein